MLETMTKNGEKRNALCIDSLKYIQRRFPFLLLLVNIFNEKIFLFLFSGVDVLRDLPPHFLSELCRR